MQITDNDVGGGKEDVCTIDDTTDDIPMTITNIDENSSAHFHGIKLNHTTNENLFLKPGGKDVTESDLFHHELLKSRK